MVSTAIAGLLSAVTAVILILAVLMTDRQRLSTVLTRGRGASAGQLTLTRLYESLVVVVPAAALGFVASYLTFPTTDSGLPYRATLALTGAAIVAIVASVLPLVLTRLGILLSESRTSRGTSPRRLVAEILIVVLAIGSLVLLRRRGNIGETGIDGIDPLLAAAPALMATAAGLLAIRIYPIPIQALAWLGSKAKGLVGFVGFRRILQQRPGSRLPILAITICVATASFSSVVQTSVAQGQEASSWQAVGGDFAIKGHSPDVNLPTSIELESFDTFGEMALGTTFAGARAELASTRLAVQTVAIDSSAFLALTSNAPVDAEALAALTGDLRPEIGTEEEPIPILVSSTWSTIAPVRVGDVFRINLVRFRPFAEVVGIIDRFPDTDTDQPFVIMDLPAIREFSELPVVPTVAYLTAPEGSTAAIEESLTGQSPSSRLISRYEILQELEEDPFVASVTNGMTVVFMFAMVQAAVAAVSSLALGSADRRRDFGYLRTMGLLSRQSTLMTAIEQFPSVVVATVTGALVGVGTAVVLDPAIDFDTFSGDLVPTALEIDWVSIGLGALAIIGILTAAVVLFVALYRGESLGRALRVGDE
jgi:putative ABC transport system permease protein